MISIIVCSVNSKLAESFRANVASTIGVEYELIVQDNRGTTMGICEVYNMCAERAKYDSLLFIHEDVIFETEGWGREIVEQLRQPKCGAIGFAGATLKSKSYSGWGQQRKYSVCNYIEQYVDGSRRHLYTNDSTSAQFQPVVTLDGVALFVSRKVWAESRFDDQLLRHFHCYDLDFTLQLFDRGYTNYVCKCISIVHFSLGKYDDAWIRETNKLHDQKWGDKLPMMVGDLSSREIRANERHVDFVYVKSMVKNLKDRRLAKSLLQGFVKRYGVSNGALIILLKYLCYRTPNTL
ncbi:MAG: glycosyltransferase [Rikenellaceae bacterium]